jgi:S1-C subfamily serine protease
MKRTLGLGVARIRAYSRAHNLLEPWRTEKTEVCTGTGFFVEPPPQQAAAPPLEVPAGMQLVYLLTCAHVVECAQDVAVVLPQDGRGELRAKVLRFVPACAFDLALLCALVPRASQVAVLPLGDSDALHQASDDTVTAVGFSLGLESLNYTRGKFSTFQNGSLQHTACISGGNSGGPLVDARGAVVGVNVAGIFGSTANNINFAVPIELYKRVRSRLFEPPSAAVPVVLRLPTFGLCFHPCDAGARVWRVLPGSPAAEAQLRVGDVIAGVQDHARVGGGAAMMMPVLPTTEVRVPWHVQPVALSVLLRRCCLEQPVTLHVIRAGAGATPAAPVTVVPAVVAAPGCTTLLPAYEPLEYVGFGGLVFVLAHANHYECDELKEKLARFAHDRATPRILLTYVEKQDARMAAVLDVGDVIDAVNGVRVQSLADVRAALMQPRHAPSSGRTLCVATESGKEFSTPLASAVVRSSGEITAAQPYVVDAAVLASLQALLASPA